MLGGKKTAVACGLALVSLVAMGCSRRVKKRTPGRLAP